MVKDSDPTKDEKFKKVVGHFLSTPPKPHRDMKTGKKADKRKRNSQSAKVATAPHKANLIK